MHTFKVGDYVRFKNNLNNIPFIKAFPGSHEVIEVDTQMTKVDLPYHQNTYYSTRFEYVYQLEFKWK